MTGGVSRAAIMAHVARELARGSSERAMQRMRESAAGLWQPAATISERYGIPLGALRAMREEGVGPRSMPRGHRFFYHVTEFDAWIATCAEVPANTISRYQLSFGPLPTAEVLPRSTPEEAGAIARWFIESRKHDVANSERCARVTADFEMFCRAKLGAVHVGGRKALWDAIKADGRFRLSQGRGEYGKHYRQLVGFGSDYSR